MHSKLILQMVWRRCAQCAGRTRNGQRCSISTASQLVDEAGRLVADPLLHGGSHCRLHLEFFAVSPADVRAEDLLVVFYDLETTGWAADELEQCM